MYNVKQWSIILVNDDHHLTPRHLKGTLHNTIQAVVWISFTFIPAIQFLIL